jgi:hypothetical protein
VTSACPDRCSAFDQFGPLSIRPCHGVCWAPRKRPARLRATYHRTHGIRYFHGCYCAGDDQLRGVTREHKGAGHTLAALRSIRAARPDGYRLFVIVDNLAAGKTPAIRRWARRENAGLCFTPDKRVVGQSGRGAVRSGAHLCHGRLGPPESPRAGPQAAGLPALA